MPKEYAPWLVDVPEPAALAQRAVALLADAQARERLAAAAAATVATFGEQGYVEGTRQLLAAAQNRRLR
jgi:hypothetical protein